MTHECKDAKDLFCSIHYKTLGGVSYWVLQQVQAEEDIPIKWCPFCGIQLGAGRG